MKICGVIAEYNPFHNGHEYHLKKAREVTGADYIVVCLSGDYVQRGLPAIADKYSRCKSALLGGADLVIELPNVFASSSSEYFAKGAVSILNAVGCDYLCFGSECGDIELLKTMALVYQEVEENHESEINFLLREGYSYVKALNEIASKYFADEGSFYDALSNDKLGISYIKALNLIKSSMASVTIKREGSGYLDNGVDADSALAIRSALRASSDPWTIKDRIPSYSYDSLFENKDRSCPVYINDFSDMLYMKIRSLCEGKRENAIFALTEYLDVSENIAGRILKNLNTFSAADRFAYGILSSEYTISRINRALLHILLDIKQTDIDSLSLGDYACYCRILGFRRESKALMSEIKKRSAIPIITKMADADKLLGDNAKLILKKEIFVSDLYEHVASNKYYRTRISEMARSPIII